MIAFSKLIIFGVGLAAGLVAAGWAASSDLEFMKKKATRIRPLRGTEPKFYDRRMRPRPTTWA